MYVMLRDAEGSVVKLLATQVVVYNNQGTPISVAAEYGSTASQKVSCVGQNDFNKVLQEVGLNPIQVLDLTNSQQKEQR